jgi:hypothetical protein
MNTQTSTLTNTPTAETILDAAKNLEAYRLQKWYIQAANNGDDELMDLIVSIGEDFLPIEEIVPGDDPEPEEWNDVPEMPDFHDSYDYYDCAYDY